MRRTPPPFGQRRIIGARAARPEARPEPEGPTPDQIARINTLTSTARANWLGLLAYLAFVGVTLIGVEDADFFIPERATQLPLIGVTIPTALFFWIAPVLGAMLYIYLHLYLMRLWEALAETPLPNSGAPLGDRVSPWLLTDFALRFRQDGALRRRPLRGLAHLVTLLLAFLAGPFVLAAFFWRSMPKHDEFLTVLGCGIPLFAVLWAGLASWLRLRRLTRGDDRLPLRSLSARVAGALAALAIAAVGWFTTEGTFAKYAQMDRIGILWLEFPFRSYHARRLEELRTELRGLGTEALRQRYGLMREAAQQVAGVPRHVSRQWARLSENADPDDILYYAERELAHRWWMQTWFPELLARANLANVDFVATPANWLDHDRAREAFRRDWCRDRNLPPEACGPVPSRDTPPPAFQAHSRQDWCRRTFAPESRDDPAACEAHFATLDDDFAERWQTHRRAAIDALPPRDLSREDLRGADLREARMEGAVLSGARMDENTSFNAATLRGAALKEVTLPDAALSTAQIATVFGDASVTLPGIAPGGEDWPDHWPQRELDWDEFEAAWRAWQATLDAAPAD